MSRMHVLVVTLAISVGCGKKTSASIEPDKKTCAATDAAFMDAVTKGKSPTAIDAIVIAGLKACSAACDAKDQGSCSVLEQKSPTWSSSAGASMAALDALCVPSKSASLNTNVCDAINASRKK